MIPVVRRQSPVFDPQSLLLSGTPGRAAGLIRPMSRGVSGNLQTLSQMADWIRSDYNDLAIIDYANSLIEGVSSHAPGQVVHSLFMFVRGFKDAKGKHWGITYRSDPFGFEQLQDARATLEKGVGDCGDKTILLGTLLAAVGIPSRLVVLSYNPPTFQHVYLEALYAGRWNALDPTPEEALPGWQDDSALQRATYPIFSRPVTANVSGFNWASLFSGGAAIGAGAAQGGKAGAITTGAAVGLNFVPVVGPILSQLVGPISSLFNKTAKNKPFSDARDEWKNAVYQQQDSIRSAVAACQGSPSEGVALSQQIIQEYYKQCDANFPKAIAASCRNFETQDVPGGPQEGGFRTHEKRIATAGANCAVRPSSAVSIGGAGSAAPGGGAAGAVAQAGGGGASLGGLTASPWLLVGGGALLVFLVTSIANSRR